MPGFNVCIPVLVIQDVFYFKYVFIYLTTVDLGCSLQDLSSLTRDQTQAPCIGSSES